MPQTDTQALDQALDNYIELEASQQALKEQFERQQLFLDSLRRKAKQFLLSHAKADEAILEIQDTYYRLYLDPDELIQIKPIVKLS